LLRSESREASRHRSIWALLKLLSLEKTQTGI
jgi:hypothetical protein